MSSKAVIGIPNIGTNKRKTSLDLNNQQTINHGLIIKPLLI